MVMEQRTDPWQSDVDRGAHRSNHNSGILDPGDRTKIAGAGATEKSAYCLGVVLRIEV